MTLSVSSFSIKDILTGREGNTGAKSTEELYTGNRGAGVHLFNPDSIEPQRLPPDPTLPAGNLGSGVYREEDTRGEKGHREGDTFTLTWQK